MKETILKWGTNNVICDRCGDKLKSDQVREEWTGLYVCNTCWEPRHPQDLIKGIPDDQNVEISRPEAPDVELDTSGWLDTKTDIPPGHNDGSL